MEDESIEDCGLFITEKGDIGITDSFGVLAGGVGMVIAVIAGVHNVCLLREKESAGCGRGSDVTMTGLRQLLLPIIIMSTLRRPT